jgi:hypothetical protein
MPTKVTDRPTAGFGKNPGRRRKNRPGSRKIDYCAGSRRARPVPTWVRVETRPRAWAWRLRQFASPATPIFCAGGRAKAGCCSISVLGASLAAWYGSAFVSIYFAYGSNMWRRRLEDRIGAVDTLGHATLHGYVHAFAKLGVDGTGKGTIIPAPAGRVEGVAYRIDDAQLARLREFEPGYRAIDVRVTTALGSLAALTFQAIQLFPDLRPTPGYVGHYLAGMTEHAFPRAYVDSILDAARLSSAERQQVFASIALAAAV